MCRTRRRQLANLPTFQGSQQERAMVHLGCKIGEGDGSQGGPRARTGSRRLWSITARIRWAGAWTKSVCGRSIVEGLRFVENGGCQDNSVVLKTKSLATPTELTSSFARKSASAMITLGFQPAARAVSKTRLPSTLMVWEKRWRENFERKYGRVGMESGNGE